MRTEDNKKKTTKKAVVRVYDCSRQSCAVQASSEEGTALSCSLKQSVFLLPVANLSSRCQHQQKICVKPTLAATVVTSIYSSASGDSLIFGSIAYLFATVPSLHLPEQIWPGSSVHKHMQSKIICFSLLE